MKRSLIFVTLLAVLGLVVTGCTDLLGELGEEGLTTGTIQGKVTDKTTSVPIEGAEIRTDPKSKDTKTDSIGGYVIADVEPGVYTITASKNGYNLASRNVVVEAEEDTAADIELTPTTPSPTATSSPIVTPSPSPSPSLTPSPSPSSVEVGMSRRTPFPRSGIISIPNWDIRVLEIVRGDAAWQAIQSANKFNDPAPEGMEYLLVKLHVKSTYTDNEVAPQLTVVIQSKQSKEQKQPWVVALAALVAHKEVELS